MAVFSRFRICDEFEHGFGWIEVGFLQRAAHALVSGDKVWLIDPFSAEGVEERVRAAGRVAGVIQLLDRHSRDCGAFAERFGVPLHHVPADPIGGAPFSFLQMARTPWWMEVALRWPETGVLVCADALGTAPYFRAAGERIGVHPLLRLVPPRDLSRGWRPTHVLCGHGEGIHGDEVATALEEALATARRRIPRWLAAQVSGRRASRASSRRAGRAPGR